MKCLMVDEKDIDRLINDFGFSKLVICNDYGKELINAIAYEYDTATYLALRKQDDKYILDMLMINPELYDCTIWAYFTKNYTCYYLPSILLKLIECGIIKECEIKDYN